MPFLILVFFIIVLSIILNLFDYIVTYVVFALELLQSHFLLLFDIANTRNSIAHAKSNDFRKAEKK